MSRRIESRFAALRARGRSALIPFVTAGDPDPALTVDILHALVEAGADVLEVGVPFSDPMADGPAIARASERALAKGVGLKRVFAMVEAFRQRDRDTPVVLMGYLNPIEIFGWSRACAEAARVGVDGLLLVDLPPEEAESVREHCVAHGVAQIFLASPTTPDERLARIGALAQGYLYYVSFAGITGADRLSAQGVAERMSALRACCSVPIVVGFGVKGAEQAGALAAVADGVVVGSALVERLAAAADPVRAAGVFLAPLRSAMDVADAARRARA
jgi:tryptophan synthase alpha chain